MSVRLFKIVGDVYVDPSEPTCLARLGQLVGELVAVDDLGHDSCARAAGDRDDRLLGGHDLEREAVMIRIVRFYLRRHRSTCFR